MMHGTKKSHSSIALTKFDGGERRAPQHDLGAGEIEPDCMSAAPGGHGRDVSGTCRHIQNPLAGCDAGRRQPAPPPIVETGCPNAGGRDRQRAPSQPSRKP